MRTVSSLPGIPLGEALGRVKGSCPFEEKTVGYVTPPLHGVWASAPYFHNGSVPTVWDVLKPADRPKVWRRQLTPEGITTGPDRGFEHVLESGYDFENLGWKHDVLACGDGGQGVPYYTCQPEQPMPQELTWLRDAIIGGTAWPIYGQVPPIGQQGVEDFVRRGRPDEARLDPADDRPEGRVGERREGTDGQNTLRFGIGPECVTRSVPATPLGLTGGQALLTPAAGLRHTLWPQ